MTAHVRPHDVSLGGAASPESRQNGVPAVVERVLPAGPSVRVSLRRSGTGEPFEAEIPHGPAGSREPVPGDAVTAIFRIAHAFTRARKSAAV